MKIKTFTFLLLYQITICLNAHELLIDVLNYKTKGKVKKITNIYLEINGDLNKESSYTFSGKMIYSFDNKGNVIDTKSYDKTNQLTFKNEFKYDKQNKKLFNLQFDENGKLFSEDGYMYTPDGRLFEIRTPSINSRTITVFRYNSTGKVIESNFFIKNTDYKTTYKYTYDHQGNIIEVAYYDDKYVLRSIFSFDTNNYIRLDLFDDNIQKISSSILNYYDYDINGNWKTRINYVKDTPKQAVFREIDYY